MNTHPITKHLSYEQLKWLKENLEASAKTLGYEVQLNTYPESKGNKTILELIKDKHPDTRITKKMLSNWMEKLGRKEGVRINNDDDFEDLISFIRSPYPSRYKQSIEGKLKLFEVVVKSNKAGDANSFYDGQEIKWAELESEFDVRRNPLLADPDMTSGIDKAMKKNEPYFIFLKGAGGVGKTTYLKRILYDLGKTDVLVVYFKRSLMLDESSRQQFINELDILKSTQMKIAVGIDDFHETLGRLSIVPSEFVNSLTYPFLFIVTDYPNKIHSLSLGIRLHIDNHTIAGIFNLSLNECQIFAKKITELEDRKLLNIKRADLNYERKLELIEKSANQHLLVAMFQMRFGEEFGKIVMKEYHNLESETQTVYSLICLFHSLDQSIPVDLAIRAALGSSSLEKLRETVEALSGIVEENPVVFRVRHKLIAQAVCKNLFHSPAIRSKALERTFKSIDLSEKQERNFLYAFFSTKNMYKYIIIDIFSNHPDGILQFYDTLNYNEKFELSPVTIPFFECFALTLKHPVINELDDACTFFNSLLEYHGPRKTFYLYQLAWIYHKQGELEIAADYAIEALELSLSPKEIFKGVQILWLNTYNNFLRSKPYLEKLITLSDLDSYRSIYEKYLLIEKGVSHLVEKDSPISLELVFDLKPSLLLVKNFRGSSREFKNKLFAKLYGMQRDTDVDEAEINDLIDDINLDGKDKDRFEGLLYCHRGRNLFLKIRNLNIPVDTKEIESCFTKSLQLFEDNAFCHTWLGTYYKDIVGDFAEAEVRYRRAISLIPKEKFNKEGTSLFYNNLGLLLMHRYKLSEEHNKADIIEALQMFDIACQNQDIKEAFIYPFESREECLQLIKEAGIEIPGGTMQNSKN